MAQPQQERQLIEAAQKDPSRFGELYEIHFDRIYAYIARRVRDRHIAEDLTSEVFQRALSALTKYQPGDVPFATWLYRIAANSIIDHAHRVSRAPAPLLFEPLTDAGIEQAEIRASIYRRVRELPDDQRRVLEMRFAEDRSIQEIAAALGRSEGAVKQLQLRGLENLRARIVGHHG